MMEKRIGDLLRERGMKIATAESCTGGLIAKKITDIAGASNYFDMGMITYGNKVKEEFLSVPLNVLTSKGAVSHDVARMMAEGIRKAANADIGLAVTGIAGPEGGTMEKPVGTVFISVAAQNKTIVRKFLFKGSRNDIREETCVEVFRLVLAFLEGRFP
jgi:PncC family amidohydrolase